MTGWWRPLFLQVVRAHYERDSTATRALAERLLSIRDLPDATIEWVRRALAAHVQSLPSLAPSFHVRAIELLDDPDRQLRAPSIAAWPDGRGFRMIVQAANPVHKRGEMGLSSGPEQPITATNYVMDVTPELEIRHATPLRNRTRAVDEDGVDKGAYEDCRLFFQDGHWWATAIARDPDSLRSSQIVLIRLDGETVEDQAPLSENAGEHAWNWIPFPSETDDAIRLLHRCSPTVILRRGVDHATFLPEVIRPRVPIARDFQGSTQVIPFDHGFLTIVREPVTPGDPGGSGYHRWVWFDPAGDVKLLSPPFVFQEVGEESAFGLASRGDDLVVSYDRGQSGGFLATVSMNEIRALIATPLDSDEIEDEERARGTGLAAAAGMPSIVSTTIAGANQESVAAALQSVVNWVDWCLLIDTGITAETLATAREIAGAKLLLVAFSWNDDVAAARNVALDAATALGADWAVTVDGDERLHPGRQDVRATLAQMNAVAVRVRDPNGSPGKERFIRLPIQSRWRGPVHPVFDDGNQTIGDLPGFTVTTAPMSSEEVRVKAERDVRLLKDYSVHHPDEPRWQFRLGDALVATGRHEEAVAAFRRGATLPGDGEDAAWAMFRAADSLRALGRPGDAVIAAAAGLAGHAGVAELPWMAGLASWEAERPDQAALWARLAIALGTHAGAGATVPRHGPFYQPALWEGPYDVLRFALRRLGDNSGADEADRQFTSARVAREASERGGNR